MQEALTLQKAIPSIYYSKDKDMLNLILALQGYIMPKKRQFLNHQYLHRQKKMKDKSIVETNRAKRKRKRI
jgi:hypothetical protein